MNPCVMYSLEIITRGHDKGREKAVIHINNINANTEIIFDRENHKELFDKLCDYMKSGEIFDLDSIKLDAELGDKE